jgi:hypothetical protein
VRRCAHRGRGENHAARCPRLRRASTDRLIRDSQRGERGLILLA